MRKQCTNSACRKFFTLPLPGGVCPHCGKAYPRLAASSSVPYVKQSALPVMQINHTPFPLDALLTRWHAALAEFTEGNTLEIAMIKALRRELIAGFGRPLCLKDAHSLVMQYLKHGTLPAQIDIVQDQNTYMKIASAEGCIHLPRPNMRKATDQRAETTAIDELDLSIRAYNCLKRAELRTVADIFRAGAGGLLAVRNLGKKSLIEILDKLTEHDFDISALKNALPASLFTNHLTLLSGEEIVLPQMLVTGKHMSLSILFARWDDLLKGCSKPAAQKIELIRILREEMAHFIGEVPDLAASKQMVEMYLNHGTLPAEVRCLPNPFDDLPASSVYTLHGSLSLPPVSKLGRQKA